VGMFRALLLKACHKKQEN